jgi:hypothetical protein
VLLNKLVESLLSSSYTYYVTAILNHFLCESEANSAGVPKDEDSFVWEGHFEEKKKLNLNGKDSNAVLNLKISGCSTRKVWVMIS